MALAVLARVHLVVARGHIAFTRGHVAFTRGHVAFTRGHSSLARRIAVFGSGHQVMVRKPLLVQSGVLLVQASLGPVALGLLLRNPRSPLGHVGLLRAHLSLIVMLLCDLRATLLKLALAGTLEAARSQPRHEEESPNEQYDYDDDCDDQDGCHRNDSLGGAPRRELATRWLTGRRRDVRPLSGVSVVARGRWGSGLGR
jgi:hypothetical protein